MIKKYANKIAQENWDWFLVYHGNVRCERCGYIGVAIDFHHTDPKQKKGARDSFAVHIVSYTFREWIKNVSYAFLCANCHRELHADAWAIEEILERVKAREAEQARKVYLFGNRYNQRLLENILDSTPKSTKRAEEYESRRSDRPTMRGNG